MPDDKQEVSCSFDEAKAGMKFKAGHAVVLVVNGLTGTKLPGTGSAAEDGAAGEGAAEAGAAGTSGEGATGAAGASGKGATGAAGASGEGATGTAGASGEGATGAEEEEKAEQDAATGDLSGVLHGPAGPLKSWPFVLKRDGQPIDDKSLDGGSTQNAFKNGKWFSDDEGAYKFAKMPKGSWVVDLFLPGGQVEVAEDDVEHDSGHRAAAPAPLVMSFHSEMFQYADQEQPAEVEEA